MKYAAVLLVAGLAVCSAIAESNDSSANMQVLVRAMTGKTITVIVETTGSVQDLKEKIQEKEGIDKDQFRLSFGGKQLQDERRLSEYKIESGSMVQISFSLPGGSDEVEIGVQTVTGKKIMLNVNPSISIGELKLKVQDKEGIPVDTQKLIINGEELNDAKTMADYNIQQQGSIVDLIALPVQESTTTTEKVSSGGSNSYFGVDADDHEAVKQRQGELGEEKFKELFGDDFNLDDLDFSHHPGEQTPLKERIKMMFGFGGEQPKNPDGKPKNTIQDALKWLISILPRGPLDKLREQFPKDPSTTTPKTFGR